MSEPHVAARRAAVQLPCEVVPQSDIDHLMDTAATLFAEHGFDGVSVRQIGAAAGWPAPSIFYHFTSKANLYEEAFAHKIEQSIEHIDNRLYGKVTGEDRLRDLVEALFDLYMGNPVLLALMQRDLAEASVNGRLRSRHQYEHFTALIRRSLNRASGSELDEELVFMIGALILGFFELSSTIHERHIPHCEASMPREKARLVRAVMRLINSA